MASRWRYLRVRRGRFFDYPITQTTAPTAPDFIPQWISAPDRRRPQPRRGEVFGTGLPATVAPVRVGRKARQADALRRGRFFAVAQGATLVPAAIRSARRTTAPSRRSHYFFWTDTLAATPTPIRRPSRAVGHRRPGTFMIVPPDTTCTPDRVTARRPRPATPCRGRYAWAPTPADVVPATPPDWAPDFRRSRRPTATAPRGAYFATVERSRITYRPNTGTTSRPGTGTTARPSSSITTRP